MNPNRDWIKEDYIDFKQNLYGDFEKRVKPEYFSNLIKSLNEALSICSIDKSFEVELVPIYTQEARTEVVKDGDKKKYCILFDVHQISLTKQFYQLIISGSSQDQIFPFLKEFIASQLLFLGKEELAFSLKDEKISRLYTTGMINHSKVYRNSLYLFKHLPITPVTVVGKNLDLFVLLHEYFHVLKNEESKEVDKYFEIAEHIYNSVLNEIYPSSYDSFCEESIQSFKNSDIDAELDLQALRSEWEFIKQTINTQKKVLIEEIASDFFALMTLTKYKINDLKSISYRNSFSEFFTSLLLFSQSLSTYSFLRGLTVSFKEEDERKVSAHSIESYFRGKCLILSVENVIHNIYLKPRMPKQFDFLEELRFQVTEIIQDLHSTELFVNQYVIIPFSNIIVIAFKAAKIKLHDEHVRFIYYNAVKFRNFREKVTYINPLIDRYIEEDWF